MGVVVCLPKPLILAAQAVLRGRYDGGTLTRVTRPGDTALMGCWAATGSRVSKQVDQRIARQTEHTRWDRNERPFGLCARCSSRHPI